LRTILVEAIEVARDVLQQQRRWARLAGVMAPLKERRMVVGIPLVNSHALVPFVGHACKVQIKRRS